MKKSHLLTRIRLISKTTLKLFSIRFLAFVILFMVGVISFSNSSKSNLENSLVDLNKENLLLVPCTNGNLGGNVFNDFNANGLNDFEPGVEGIDVTIFGLNESSEEIQIESVVTDDLGDYSFTDPAITFLSNEKYRIEFSGWSEFYSPSLKGNSNNGATIIVSELSCNNNFGLVESDSYCQNDPFLITSCFVEGDQGATSGDVMVSWQYSVTPEASESDDINNISHESLSGQIGTTFGLAYHKRTNSLFAAAHMKRFAGFAPGTGPSSIFIIDNPSDNNTNGSEFLSLDEYFGANTAGNDIHDFSTVDLNPLPSVTQEEVLDAQAFDAVGKYALGDIELNTKQDILYVVNLFDRTLYAIPLGSDPKNPVKPSNASEITTTSLVQSSVFDQINATVGADELRPFALKYYKQKLYIGMVGSGQSGGDLVGVVFEFDPVNEGLTKVLETSLVYARGCAFGINDGGAFNICAGPADWNPWVSSWPQNTGGGEQDAASVNIKFISPSSILALEEGHPQPMLTDLEFDKFGNMILGLRDRVGDQCGTDAPYPGGEQVRLPNGNYIFTNNLGSYQNSPNPSAPPGFVNLYITNQDAFGDLLLATKSGSNYSVNLSDFEDDTETLPNTQMSFDNCVPGEAIFNGDCYNDGLFVHEETSMGGLAVLLHQNVLIAPAMDPRANAFSNGVDWFDLDNPTSKIKSITILTEGNSPFGKAYGLGEMEVQCSLPPIQIGDYVWSDLNGDGIQNSNENGIEGVNVNLYNADKDPIGNTITNSTGNYLFDNSNTTEDLEPEEQYFIVFGESQFDSNTDLLTINGTDQYLITIDSVGTGDNPNYNDSDIESMSTMFEGAPFTTLTTSEFGANHSYDAGFIPKPIVTIDDVDIFCGPVDDGGSMSVTVVGGVEPFTYDWSEDDYDNMTDIMNVPLGSYSLTVTDGSGCEVIASVDITDEPCPPNPCMNGEMGGTVFNDSNGNGIDDGNEGFETVRVQIFRCNTDGTSELIETVYTDQNGDYHFTDSSIIDGENYRVEFSNIPTGYTSSIEGSDNGTETQYVDEVSCDVNFGIFNPDYFCQETPLLAVACYVNGLRTGGGPQDAIVAFDYGASNTSNPAGKQIIATKGQVGSVWGMSYSPERGTIYSATFLKRNIDLGPGGLGQIYSSNVGGGANGVAFVTIPNAGTEPVNRGLGGFNAPSADADAFSKIGKVGLGDMDISEDEKFLYVTNLNDKKLYIVDIDMASVVGSYDIPNPGCTNGEFRPFATKVKGNKVYVGGLCDGSVDGASGSSNANMVAYVYEFDIVSEAFNTTEVLTFPLNYAKNYSWSMPPANNTSKKWFPWDDIYSGDFSSFDIDSRRAISHPVPMLSDIDFTDDNRMILAFADRTGHQFNDQNRLPNDSKLVALISGGDILIADPASSNSWTIETLSTTQELEFFEGDRIPSNVSGSHLETSHGGVSVIPGKEELVLTAMDPYAFTTGGVIYLSTSTGLQPRTGVQLYQGNSGSTGFSGKGVGLGDIETLCDNAPLQLGNYVWVDANGDGIQDPCETAIEGLMIKLYTKPETGEDAELVATTLTDEDGEYYFTNNTIVGETWETGFEKVEKGEEYFIVICGESYDDETGVIVANGALFSLTGQDTGMGINPDFNDSDASEQIIPGIGAFPAICVSADSVNHTLDVGLLPKPDVAIVHTLDPNYDFSDLNFGDSVKFKMVVYNQSLSDIDSLEITNYIPEGFTFDATIAGNENWTNDVNGNPAIVIQNSIASLEQDSVCIFLTIEPTDDPVNWINVAEISKAWNNGEEIEDCDSPLNNDPEDNVGSEINSPADDYIDGDGTATEPGGDPATDQDNVDPATVPICDLALINTIAEMPTNIRLGDTIKYAVIIVNQGTVPATNINIDYTIPNGFSYLDSNDDLLPAWSEGTGDANAEISEVLGIGEKDTLCIYLTVNNVAIDELTEDSWTTFAEIASFEDPEEPGIDKSDVDSTPNGDPTDDPGGNPEDDTDDVTTGDGTGDPEDPAEDSDPLLDEDDHDPAIIYVCDAATIIYTDNTDPIRYGDTIKFNVVVFNQGNGPITNIDLNDFLGGGLEFLETSVNDAENWSGDNDQVSVTITEIINPGESDTTCLELIIVDVLPFDEDAYLQVVEIAEFQDPNAPGEPKVDIDSTPDDNPDNDSGGNPEDNTDDEIDGNGTGDEEDTNEDSDPELDEDDNDPVLVQVFDLALDKVVQEDKTYSPGEKPVFEITVYNQGNVSANNFKVVDYIRDGFTFSTMNNAGWNEMGDYLVYTSSSPLDPGESVTITLELTVVIPMVPMGVSDWWNYAEILEADNNTNTDDPDPTDADSNPNDVETDDNMVMPDGPDDDVITENGIDGDDEDDHDPAKVIVGYDLALRKTVTPEGPYSYDDTLTYTITIFNQGGLAVSDIDIYDSIPCGLEYLEDINDWSFADNIATTTLEDVLGPSQMTTKEIKLVVQRCDEPAYDNYLNIAEIYDFSDENGDEPLTDDIDSTPNDDPSDDGTPNDDAVDDPMEEDDHDIENIEVCDLALVNMIVEVPDTIQIYDTVKYEVVVFNQGNTDVTSASINYYIPNGLSYLPINSSLVPMWESEVDGLANVNTGQVIAPGESDTICLYLQIENVSTEEVSEDSWTTIAEITAFEDFEGEVKTTDADSSPDDSPTNDPGGNPEDDTDDEIDGDGTGDPEVPEEDSDPEKDEDDHDPALFYVCDIATIIYSDIPDDINYYDTLKYNIVVSNQGNDDVTNVLIVDHLPEGFALLPTDSNEEEGWEASTTIDGAITIMYDEILTSGQSDTICLEVELLPVHSGSTEESWLQLVEVVQFEAPESDDGPKKDIDSTPDDDPTNDPGGNPEDDTDDVTDGDGTGDPEDPQEDEDPELDEDDHDPVDTKIFDLALIMQIDSMPPVLPVVPGDVLKFIVVVSNQGNTPANNVEITNYLMDENLALADTDGNDGWDLLDSENNEFMIEEELLPGEKDTVCIYLEVLGGAMTDIVTYSEISGATETDEDCYDIDSMPDDQQDDDAGGNPETPEDDHIEDDGEDGNDDGITDEDDHDPAMLDGQDLALIIWSNQKEPVQEGQDVKFTIRVTNQGNITNENIKIVDYLPAGFELSENDDNGWEYDDLIENQVTKTLEGPLAMDEVVETCILLTVQKGVSASDLINYAEIVSSNDPDGLDLTELDIDSSPNNIEDDDTGGQYEDMPDCTTDPIVINDDNYDEGAGVNDEDEDDHDPAWVHVFDLASIIYTDQTEPIIPGDELKFNVEVHNQGNMSATDIDLLIHMPDGFTLSENDDNDWDIQDGVLMGTYNDDLIPEQIDTLCLILELLPDFTLTDLIPVVEIAGAMDTLGNDRDDFDLDSDPNESAEDDEGGEIFTEDDDSVVGNGEEDDDEDDHDPAVPPVMDLAIKIVTVDETPKMPGDIVKFSITVYNQGSMTPSEFTIENYVPEGLIFVNNSDNSGWLPKGDSNATFVYDDELLPLTSDTLCIYLQVAPGANPKNVVDMVEIIQIIDQLENDVSLLDIDSESDDSNENDLGNDLYSLEDNKTDENGRSGFDEDDHDQAFVNMCQGIACNGHMNISVDQNCEAEITPTVVLTGDIFPDHVYDVVITNSDGEEVSNMFGGDDIGESFTVSVSNPLCDDNSCWMTILIEDKWAPQIICQNDTLSCSLAYDDSTRPTIINDNCSGGELILLDEVVETLSCDSMFTSKLTRVWVAKDEAGNMSEECIQEIYLLRTNLDSIMPVMNFMLATNNAISCSSGYETDTNGHPAPSVTGVPKLRLEDGSFMDLYPFDAMQICNGFVEYNDEVLAGSTSCVTKILRTWVVGEWWCSQTNQREFVQLIEIVDFEGPTVSCPSDLTISTSSFSCEGYTSFDLPVATDACNGDEIRIDLSAPSSPTGFIKDYAGQILELPVGVNELTYHVYDGCDNRTDCTFRVTVQDNADPIAICDQFTSIGFGLEDLTKVSAEAIDDGSFDECGPVDLAVARMDAPGFDDLIGFGPDVDITCADIGTNVMVGLLVTDAGGNTNMCMVSIEVTDKIDAKFTCPEDMEVECNFAYDPSNLGAFFGEVEIFDNCPDANTVDDRLVGELNSCGSGILIRELTLFNAQGEQVDYCTQQITFRNGDLLQYSDITPPVSEVTVTGCGIESIDPSILGMPIVPDGNCQQTAIGIENDTFPFTSNGACLKIIRTFKVIDWCIDDGPGSVLQPFEFTQTIKVNNTEGPEIENVFADSIFCSYEIGCGAININGYLTATVTDDCTANDDLLNRYEVKDSDGIIVKSGSELDASGTYDVDTYTVRFISEDKCGNQEFEESTFEVRSCKLPTPYCLQGLSTTLTAMDTTGDGSADVEMVMLPASFFDAGSYHPCGYDVQLSFSSNVDDTIATFFCSDTVGLQPIELWVTDENGGQDYCSTFVDIQDNDTIDLCGDLKPVDIVGRIYTELDAEVKSVPVEMRSAESIQSLTDEDGIYEFANMPQGGNYQVIPNKDDDHLNGVSTLDLVMIQRHILGVAPLGNVYKRLAADINNDEKISAADLLALRKVILGIDIYFANNTSWRFIDAQYDFVNDENPWETKIDEIYKIIGLSADMQIDFLAVKTGDVNGNVDVNVATEEKIEKRSNTMLTLALPDLSVERGKIYEVEVRSTRTQDVYGMQYSLDFEDLELVDVIPAKMDMSKDNTSNKDGQMNVSYASRAGDKLSDAEVMYTMIIKAENDGLLSEMIGISPNGLDDEAYSGEELAVGGIEISWSDEEVGIPVELFSVKGNSPNPWRNSTEILFQLPRKGAVNLIVTDVSGRLLVSKEGEFEAGMQRIILTHNELPNGGVLLYELQFEDHVEKGKMIRID